MIRLTTEHWHLLVNAAEAAYPEEACGLLVGCEDAGGNLIIGEVIAAANVAPEPRRRFEIDPQLHFQVLRRLRGSEARIVGHYHSHPDAPAEPSPRDREAAGDDQMIWLILAVAGGRLAAAAAFAPVGGDERFSWVDLTVQP